MSLTSIQSVKRSGNKARATKSVFVKEVSNSGSNCVITTELSEHDDGFSLPEILCDDNHTAYEGRGGYEVNRYKRVGTGSTKKNFWEGGVWQTLAYIWVRRPGTRVTPCRQ